MAHMLLLALEGVRSSELRILVLNGVLILTVPNIEGTILKSSVGDEERDHVRVRWMVSSRPPLALPIQIVWCIRVRLCRLQSWY